MANMKQSYPKLVTIPLDVIKEILLRFGIPFGIELTDEGSPIFKIEPDVLKLIIHIATLEKALWKAG